MSISYLEMLYFFMDEAIPQILAEELVSLGIYDSVSKNFGEKNGYGLLRSNVWTKEPSLSLRKAIPLLMCHCLLHLKTSPTVKYFEPVDLCFRDSAQTSLICIPLSLQVVYKF